MSRHELVSWLTLVTLMFIGSDTVREPELQRALLLGAIVATAVAAFSMKGKP